MDKLLTISQSDSELVVKVKRLFIKLPNPATQEAYTLMEVEEATGRQVRYHWLRKLLLGEIDSPGINQLRALSDFFGAEASYWMDDLDAPIVLKNKAAAKPIIPTTDGGRASLRGFDELPEESQKFVQDVVDTMRRRGLT